MGQIDGWKGIDSSNDYEPIGYNERLIYLKALLVGGVDAKWGKV